MKNKPPTPSPAQRSIHLNWKDWLPYLEDSNATEADKKKVIETVWSIAMAFVDLGWDINASEESSGQSFDLTVSLQAAVLNLVESQKQQEEAV